MLFLKIGQNSKLVEIFFLKIYNKPNRKKDVLMIEFKQATLDKETIDQLLELSANWVREDCSFGIVANAREDLKEPCFIALDGNKIVGYTFGHFYVKENKTSCIEIGSRCFDVDELYVLPEYRDKKIGGTLFKMIENFVKNDVDYITLSTPTKDYKRTLKFYVDNVDMTFHSAYLIKKTK